VLSLLCDLWIDVSSYLLTRVVLDKIHRAVKRLCVCVCVVLAVSLFISSQLFEMMVYGLVDENEA